ncbi:MAG: DUF454 domain-containing protein [Ruminococcaceae bacterium]|nr:DUF454 domain-containing protein [Oscillospiraceae bacterium]
MKIKRIFWIIIGCVGVGLGAIGAVVPMLPSFPFLLLAAFSFAKSSERLHSWFVGTNLYKKNLESYVKGRGMTRATKIRAIIIVTLLMSFGFIMMFRKGIYIPCIILACVWIFHIVYFIFGIRTYEPETENTETQKSD